MRAVGCSPPPEPHPLLYHKHPLSARLPARFCATSACPKPTPGHRAGKAAAEIPGTQQPDQQPPAARPAGCRGCTQGCSGCSGCGGCGPRDTARRIQGPRLRLARRRHRGCCLTRRRLTRRHLTRRHLTGCCQRTGCYHSAWYVRLPRLTARPAARVCPRACRHRVLAPGLHYPLPDLGARPARAGPNDGLSRGRTRLAHALGHFGCASEHVVGHAVDPRDLRRRDQGDLRWRGRRDLPGGDPGQRRARE